MRFFLKYILIWILLLVSISATSQGFKKKFIDAEYHYMFEEFSEALPIYLEISNSQPDNANINYRIGICYLHLPDPKENEKALPYLQKAITNINPKYKEGSYLEKGAPKDAFFYLGNVYRNKLDFDNAIESYKKYRDILNSKEVFYIDYIDREIQCTQNAKELVKLPLKLKSQNLGDEINSQTNQINSPIDVENCPVVSDNETVFVFTAGNKNVFSSEIDLNIINADYKMDNICFSKKNEGKWTEPKNITRQLGAKSRVVPVTISADGTELYLVRDDNDNGNIYISHYKNDRWTKMEPLNKNINTKNWESHATITVDGKTLYFTSDRKGGFGGLDIYRSDRDEKGDWGPAVNLGSTINTKYDEETPTILNDSKTMYFSSQGHYCMGGFDAFYTTLLANNTWSAPLNVGYPINTVGNDLFYIPKANGEYAFFPLNNNEREIATNNEEGIAIINEGKIGTNNIYKIIVSIPEGHETEILLKGNIILQDQKNELPHDFIISVIDSIKGDTVNKCKPNYLLSNYLTQIKSGSFKIEYKCNGYLTHYEQLYIPNIYTRTEVNIDVEMLPLEVSKGEYYVIRSIFFDYAKYDLKKESETELQRLADLMQKNPSLYVEIVGHTDALGSVQLNQKLSENRSKAAIDYLVSQGIDQSHFVSKGMGKTHFIAINKNPDGSDNPEGRQLNRRVEIKILNSTADNITVEEIKVPENLLYSRAGRLRPNDKYTILLIKQKEKSVSTDDVSRLINLTTKLKSNELFASVTGSPVSEAKVNDMLMFTAGEFTNKSDAMKILNIVVDENFPDATIESMSGIGKIKHEIGNDYKQHENDNVDVSLDKTLYTIQISALTKPADLSVFKNLKGVKENLCQDGFYRYTYGKFEGINSAKQEKQHLIELGYTNTFIVKTDNFYSKVESVGEFTIQLESLAEPVNLSHFKNLKGVKELIGNDQKYKYIYGKYSSVDDARKELNKIKKYGYENAFVVNMNKFN